MKSDSIINIREKMSNLFLLNTILGCIYLL